MLEIYRVAVELMYSRNDTKISFGLDIKLVLPDKLSNTVAIDPCTRLLCQPDLNCLKFQKY